MRAHTRLGKAILLATLPTLSILGLAEAAPRRQASKSKASRTVAAATAPAAPVEAAPPPAPTVTHAIDVVRALHPGDTGIATAANYSRTVNSYLHTVTFTPRAHKAYEFAHYFIESVDFDAVLSAPFAKSIPEGYKAFGIKGEGNSGKSYTVDYVAASTDTMAPATFAAFGADLRIREDKNPIPGESRGFGVRGDAKINVGELNHRNVLQATATALRLVSPRNLLALASASTNKSNPDAVLMAETQGILPESMAMLQKYTTVTPGIRMVGAGETEYSQFDSKVTLSLSTLTRDYPDFGNYLESLASKIQIQGRARYELPNGLRIAEGTLDTKARTVTGTIKTAGGRLIPYDKSGVPHFEAAIAPESTNRLVANLVVEGSATVLGLTFRVSDVTFSTVLQDGPVAEGQFKLVKLPVPKVEGKALGILPTWAVDAFIPGSMEGYAKTFTDGLMQGSRGQGTSGSVTVDTRNANNTAIEAKASSEFVDNFFITFGVRVAQTVLWPNEKVLASGWKLTTDSSDVLSKDLQRLASR